MSTEVDVVVVGSGAGGSPVALELAAAGARVLVLEKGPRHATRDFLHDEISMCRRDFFVPFAADDPHTLRRDPSARAERTQEGWISQCVGGGTVHMSGFFFRLHPKDFALQRSYGPIPGTTAIDWPFGYEVLAPYYDRVEREVGVSGDAGKSPFEPPRGGPFPYPPVLTHPIARTIDRVALALGMHAFPVPRAILTRPEEGRGACVYCPLCGSYGCEVGAKGSTLASLLPKAEATGRCEIRARAMVTEVVLDRRGRAKGVLVLDEAGRGHEVRARAVVVACSAIESARLLLLSRSSRHPDGLGNGSGQVGRNLCFSTLGQVAGELHFEDFGEAARAELREEHPFVGRAVQDFHEVPPEGDGFGKGGTFHLLWEHPNPIHRAERLVRSASGLVYGGELMRGLHARFVASRTLEAECFSEWLPTEGCHVSLDPEVTDRFGLPAARITIGRHPSDRAASRALVERARTLLEAIGARRVHTLAEGGETLVLQHGTCRMGEDPRGSVTTPEGHLHEVDNVYVADGGALPSSGSAPSTMTIMANSFRIAEGIRSRLETGAL